MELEDLKINNINKLYTIINISFPKQILIFIYEFAHEIKILFIY
jgi:hypothetical protein